jgi:amidase
MSDVASLYDLHDAVGLAGLVQRREVTSMELVDEAIRRIEQQNTSINAVVYAAFETARQAAI